MSLPTLHAKVMQQVTPTYTSYYNGKMSYRLHGKEWKQFVATSLNDVVSQATSENIFKDVVDLYAENLIPALKPLQGFRNCTMQLLTRGEAIAIRTKEGQLIWPERYEVISDGDYHIAAVFTRSLRNSADYCTIIDSESTSTLLSKPIPEDFSHTREGYSAVESEQGHTLYRFALDDRGIGASLSSLQDRVNHSIIDQTVIAEMYTRPFWYLLKYSAPPSNPFIKNPALQPQDKGIMREMPSHGAAGRIFATSSDGPFGQLEPPTLQDMIDYHNSLIQKVSQSFGIPEYYFQSGAGNNLSGTALRALSRRFNNRISRMRDAIEPELQRLAADLALAGEQFDVELDGSGNFPLWSKDNDLLQESTDQHGIALKQMGYPLDYIAEVVTPEIDLDEYGTDGYTEYQPSVSISSSQSPANETQAP